MTQAQWIKWLKRSRNDLQMALWIAHFETKDKMHLLVKSTGRRGISRAQESNAQKYLELHNQLNDI